MEITITHNININAPALVDFFREAIAVQTKGNSIVRTPAEVAAARTLAGATVGAGVPVDKAPAFIEKEIAAQNAAALSSDAPDAPRPPRAPRAKKDSAPAAATPATPAAASAEGGEFANPEAWTKDEKEKHLATVRARLSDYSADKRYGMDGVFAILKKYGVERITALPTDRYAEFKAELDAALAKPTVDPLA